MEIGLTVGTEIDRIEATAMGSEFVEFGLAELPQQIDEDRLSQALAETGVALDVHLPFEQVLAT